MKLATAGPLEDSKRKLSVWIALHILILLALCLALPLLIAYGGGAFSQPLSPFRRAISSTTTTQQSPVICYADGSAHFAGAKADSLAAPTPLQQAWVPTLFLSITLGFGSFSFSAAKGIDVAWDLVVGRGGQMVLTLVTYPVVRRALAFCMETQPVSLELYSSIAFDRGFSLPSLRALCTFGSWGRPARLRSARRVGRWWIYVALVLIGMYLLAFPTLASTMTGYQAKLTPYASDPSDGRTLLDLRTLTTPEVVVVDGHRVGFDDYYRGNYSSGGNSSEGRAWEWLASGFWSYGQTINLLGANLARGAFDRELMRDQVSGYNLVVIDGVVDLSPDVDQYDYDGAVLLSFAFPQNLSSTRQVCSNLTLPAPWNRTVVLETPPLDVAFLDQGSPRPGVGGHTYYWANGTMLSSAWLRTASVCQPSNAYQWGFSAGMLLTFAGCTAVYAILLVMLHWHVHMYSQADRFKQTISMYSDILDVAEELRLQLGDGVRFLPVDKLDGLVREADGEIALETQELALSRHAEAAIRRRAKKTKAKRARTAREQTSDARTRRKASATSGSMRGPVKYFYSRLMGASSEDGQRDEEGHEVVELKDGKQSMK